MRTIRFAMLALAASIAITGCATKKDFYAMGGSRADGTVNMAYDFAQFEQPVVNMDQAKSIAKSKCQVWGYQDAEAFGGKTQHCNQFNGYGTCIAGQVVLQYQCIGNGSDRASVASFTPLPAQAVAATAGALSRDQWKQQQLDKLNAETGLSYDEYQRRYRQIMGQ
ncbi:YecR family lipoprotein [Pseudomonas panipatensis]|uniref:YecR-like lipoprotein n=1 Tax=Pseudomonas panipatensis TaxID=428992 RepID=A0A1G8HJN0_9PSED|nr:YecR family lipoprotein [Pseudomonas panipatensis]SDI06660.1 YecR-like lipoprotein [Pseudomonas panipatensis]SMP58551.1 YecR-like lipoprotein [Pseudomonas panipatensis]